MDKKRKEIAIDPKVFEELEKLAKKEQRSLNNYIEKILTDYVGSKTKGKTVSG